MKILVVSGPNLQRLGKREPEIYGYRSLEDLHQELAHQAVELGIELECRQSNHEGTLLDWLGSAADEGFDGIVFNAGAYTHTSLALHDGVLASCLPTVEVHLSNPEARESYRHRSVLAAACVGKVAGFGFDSYRFGVLALVARLRARSQ